MKKFKNNSGTPLTRNEMKQISGGAKHRTYYVYKCSNGAAYCGSSTCQRPGCSIVGYCSNPSC